MARRTFIIALFMVFTQMATACHHRCHCLRKHHFRSHCVSEDIAASCSCATPIAETPVIPAEQIPLPRKMPTTSVSPFPVTAISPR